MTTNVRIPLNASVVAVAAALASWADEDPHHRLPQVVSLLTQFFTDPRRAASKENERRRLIWNPISVVTDPK
jgi:hypothetical protein